MGLFLVSVAVAVWILGQFVQRGGSRKGIAVAVAVAVLTGGYVYALENKLQWRSPAEPDAAGQASKPKPGEIDWKPWSQEAVENARAKGRVVFVDFTADWCLNCQANKKTSIEIDSVRKRLKELDAVTLLADFTRTSKAIAAELQRHGRAGVPLVLVYPKDAEKPPIVLPELLTPSIVLDALEQASR
jgi:thiol:disulfide interchange protein DsbD